MAQQTNDSKHPLRVVVFDNMRTRSHIFSRIFSEHPQLQQVYHPYLECSFLGPERMTPYLKHSERREKEITEDWAPIYVKETFGSSRRKLEKDVAEIEETGKSAWISEHSCLVLRQDIMLCHNRGHAYTPHDLGPNPTYVPDWLFETCTPIVVIRHPALSVPSFYKIMSGISYNLPGDEDFYLCTSFAYCRLIFDVLKSQGRTPIVVDGEDVVWRTREMGANVCKALGIDPESISEDWEPTPQEKRPTNPIIAGFTKTIHESTGVERPGKKPDGPVDIDVEVKKIAETHGQEVAEQLREYILKMMPDYEYMSRFKV